MSELKVKKSKPMKVKNVNFQPTEEVSKPEEPKKRTRAKKQPPTKEEAIKMLEDTSKELCDIIKELSEEGVKIKSMNLPRLNELVTETLANLEEDKEEINEKINEIKNMSEELVK